MWLLVELCMNYVGQTNLIPSCTQVLYRPLIIWRENEAYLLYLYDISDNSTIDKSFISTVGMYT